MFAYYKKLIVASVLVASLAFAKADDDVLKTLVEEHDDILEDEARAGSVFTSNGNYFIALNTTQLLFFAALLGAALLAALALSSSFAYDTSGYGYGQQGSSGYGGSSSGSEHGHTYRQKRFADSDLASQMYQLAMAFKKYEVKDTECQLFVACEASQIKEVAEATSVLAEIANGVKPLMKNMSKHGRKAVVEKDQYVAKLLDAFMFGEDMARKNTADACQSFKQKCYSQNKKPVY